MEREKLTTMFTGKSIMLITESLDEDLKP